MVHSLLWQDVPTKGVLSVGAVLWCGVDYLLTGIFRVGCVRDWVCQGALGHAMKERKVLDRKSWRCEEYLQADDEQAIRKTQFTKQGNYDWADSQRSGGILDSTISCHYLMSLCHVIISCHYLMSLSHVIISCHYLMSLSHVIILCHYVMSLCHVIMSCHYLMSLSHVIMPCHYLMSLSHVIMSCHYLMSLCLIHGCVILFQYL
jgi:hypothetical protein